MQAQQVRPHLPWGIINSADGQPSQSTHLNSQIEDPALAQGASSSPGPGLLIKPETAIITSSSSSSTKDQDSSSTSASTPIDPDMMDSYQDSQASTSSSTLSLASESPLTTPGSASDNGDGRNGFFNDAETASQIPFNADPKRYILVIGGLGFIGSHTVLELLRNGYNVIIVDNLSNSYLDVLFNVKKLAAKDCIAKGRVMPAVRFHKLDYQSRDMQCLLDSYSEPVPAPTPTNGSQQRVTYRSQIVGVIHFAAYKSVVESMANPLDYYDNNVCGLVRLLRQLARYNIRNFVFSSSATVYGTMAKVGKLLREEDIVHHEETFVDESGKEIKAEPTMVGLTSPYARSKYFAEAILADVAASDPDWRIVSLRYFNPIGCDPSGLIGESPRQTPTNLFPVIAQVLTGDRERLDIFGSDWNTADGTPVRDFIHVSDIARGHIAALDRACEVPFRTYNLGSGTGTTVHEAVKSLEAASGKPINVNWSDRRPGDVEFCVASNTRANKELGWTPRESIAKCARDLWNYVRRVENTDKK